MIIVKGDFGLLANMVQTDPLAIQVGMGWQEKLAQQAINPTVYKQQFRMRRRT